MGDDFHPVWSGMTPEEQVAWKGLLAAGLVTRTPGATMWGRAVYALSDAGRDRLVKVAAPEPVADPAPPVDPKLKVYGWGDFRREAPGPHHQTYEITAARSMAEIYRITGKRKSAFQNLHITGNKVEIAMAMSHPGTVFWQGLNVHRDAPWTAVDPTI